MGKTADKGRKCGSRAEKTQKEGSERGSDTDRKGKAWRGDGKESQGQANRKTAKMGRPHLSIQSIKLGPHHPFSRTRNRGGGVWEPGRRLKKKPSMSTTRQRRCRAAMVVAYIVAKCPHIKTWGPARSFPLGLSSIPPYPRF